MHRRSAILNVTKGNSSGKTFIIRYVAYVSIQGWYLYYLRHVESYIFVRKEPLLHDIVGRKNKERRLSNRPVGSAAKQTETRGEFWVLVVPPHINAKTTMNLIDKQRRWKKRAEEREVEGSCGWSLQKSKLNGCQDTYRTCNSIRGRSLLFKLSCTSFRIYSKRKTSSFVFINNPRLACARIITHLFLSPLQSV